VNPVEVTLLTQEHCTFCDLAKEILDRVGRDHPLRVREVDLASAEGQRLATTVGVLFAPGVLLDGEAFSYGRLSERKLRRALDRRSGTANERLRSW
jgi:glutaredoxin